MLLGFDRKELIKRLTGTGKTLPLSSWNSAHLDVVRSLATLAVVAEHTFRLFFLTDALPTTMLAGVAETCSRVAGESVMVFFVLSGFFICSIIKRSFKTWTWSRYLIDRMSRLYVVLLPALLFTAAIDWWTARTAGASLFLNQPLLPFLETPISQHHTAGVFLGNLSFLQLVFVPAFGSDLPLWSLSSEFWYYMMFPCFCLALAGSIKRERIAAGLVFTLFVVLFPHRIVKYMLIWLLGALVYLLPSMRMSSLVRRVLLAMVSLAAAFLLFSPRLQDLTKWHLDLSFSILLATWLFLLARVDGDPGPVNVFYRRFGAALAACSYSIYVTHFPILLMIRSYRAGSSWILSPRTAAYGLVLVASMTGFGWCFAQATERHTPAARRLLMALTGHPYQARLNAWWTRAQGHWATVQQVSLGTTQPPTSATATLPTASMSIHDPS